MLTDKVELNIRKSLSGKLSLPLEDWEILPVPIYYRDKADYFAGISSGDFHTRKRIEREDIKFCAISFLKFEDSPGEGCEDNPLVRFIYNYYFFRQVRIIREDEADEFLKKNLESYQDFIQKVLAAKNAFQGLSPLDTEDEGIDIKTKSLSMPEFVEDTEICRYIPNIKGHAVDLEGVVEILIEDE